MNSQLRRLLKMFSLEEGIAAYESENYVTAFKILLPLAEEGNPQAQSSVGSMYDVGLGVGVDAAKAMYWYNKAALQGHPVAQNNLAAFHIQSNNLEEAVKWYRRAAEQGFPFAQEALGDIYSCNLGSNNEEAKIMKNEAEAVKFYKKAAEQGFPIASYRLGEMYANGIGVEQDRSEAMKWYFVAAQENYEPALKVIRQANQNV